MHDEHLEGLRQMLVKGTLEDGPDSGSGPAGSASASGPAPGAPEFVVGAVVTANGRSDTGQMPHAGAPLHMLQFLSLGRRQARAYLRKRGTPWPPIPYDDIGRAVRG